MGITFQTFAERVLHGITGDLPTLPVFQALFLYLDSRRDHSQHAKNSFCPNSTLGFADLLQYAIRCAVQIAGPQKARGRRCAGDEARELCRAWKDIHADE